MRAIGTGAVTGAVLGVAAVAAAVALAACGGGGGSGGGGDGGSVADQDARAACAALARSHFDEGSLHNADTASAARLPAANALATAATTDGRYAGLAKAIGGVFADFQQFELAKAPADRTSALSTCKGLGLPSSDGSGAKGDAEAGCDAAVRTPLAAAVPDKADVARASGAQALFQAALSDKRFTPLAAASPSLAEHVAALDTAASRHDITAVLAACSSLGLPH